MWYIFAFCMARVIYKGDLPVEIWNLSNERREPIQVSFSHWANMLSQKYSLQEE